MKVYSTIQAGELLGLSPATVQWYCRTYPEIGTRLGKRPWVLDDNDLSRIREHMADGPGPKKRTSVRSGCSRTRDAAEVARIAREDLQTRKTRGAVDYARAQLGWADDEQHGG